MSVSRKQTARYYFLFVLTYSLGFFAIGAILGNYESTWDGNGELWALSSMNTGEAISYILWYVINFPTGYFDLGAFNLVGSCLVNPFMVGFTLTIIFKSQYSKQVISRINMACSSVIVLLTLFYFLTL